jgi:hypothetical protein
LEVRLASEPTVGLFDGLLASEPPHCCHPFGRSTVNGVPPPLQTDQICREGHLRRPARTGAYFIP